MDDLDSFEDCLTDEHRAALVAVNDCEANFSAFLKAAAPAGLDPASSFRFTDLREMDFSGSDISGFDFTGADLRGAIGLGVTWNASTKFDNALLDGSIFAHSIRLARLLNADPSLRRRVEILHKGHWTDVPLWLDSNLRHGDAAKKRAANVVARALFELTESAIIRTEILYSSSQIYETAEEYRDFLLHTMASRGEVSTEYLKSCLSILAKLFTTDPACARVFCKFAGHSDSEVRAIALSGFAKCRTTAVPKAEVLRDALSSEPSKWVRASVVSALARYCGEEYSSSVRDPTSSGHTIDCSQTVTNDLIERIAFRVLVIEQAERHVHSKEASSGNIPLNVSAKRVHIRAEQVRQALERLAALGVPFVLEARKAAAAA